MPLVSFYTPYKHQKIRYFLMFLGVVEKHQGHKIGQRVLCFQISQQL